MGNERRRVLFVSKPVEPPWNDSSKNLVRDVDAHLRRYLGTTMVSASNPEGAAIYESPGHAGFAPALRENARVLRYLLKDRSHALWHFFFAPNPRTGFAGHLTRALRRVPSVHTICSAPKDFSAWRSSLFADRVVVLSEHTESRLIQAGFPSKRLRRIVPALPALEALSTEERMSERVALGLDPDKAVVIYAGDLEFGGGAELCLDACRDMDVQLVMACRTKTARASEVEAELRRRGNATWVGETRRIHALLGCADTVLLPGTSLYAKMDYPLVVLEAMSMGQPVVVGAGTPAEELAEGGALACEPSVQAVQNAITTALSDGPALGTRGAAYVRERFTASHVAEQYEALYDEVLGER